MQCPASIEVRKTYEKPTLRKLAIEQAKLILFRYARDFMELIFPGSRKHPIADAETKKVYARPTLRKLTPEQAKLIVIGHATIGDQGANDLLMLIFPDPNATPHPSSCGEDQANC